MWMLNRLQSRDGSTPTTITSFPQQQAAPSEPIYNDPKLCLPPPPKCSSIATWNGKEYVCTYKCEGSYDPAGSMPGPSLSSAFGPTPRLAEMGAYHGPNLFSQGPIPGAGPSFPGAAEVSTQVARSYGRSVNIFQAVDGDGQPIGG